MFNYTFSVEVTIDGRVYELEFDRRSAVCLRAGDHVSAPYGDGRVAVLDVVWLIPNGWGGIVESAYVDLAPTSLKGKREEWTPDRLAHELGFAFDLDNCSQWESPQPCPAKIPAP